MSSLNQPNLASQIKPDHPLLQKLKIQQEPQLNDQQKNILNTLKQCGCEDEAKLKKLILEYGNDFEKVLEKYTAN